MKQLPQAYSGPGLVDIQVNGYAGVDFNSDPAAWEAKQFRKVARALDRRGVMIALPTFITDDPAVLIARADKYRQIIEEHEDLAAVFPKLHIEGPFISPADGPRGAHAAKWCCSPRQCPDLIQRLRDASGGRVGIVTLAPELPGAMELIAWCLTQGIVPAIGHTQADSATLARAAEAGAKVSTHLGNGSHQVLPRTDNYVQAQLADDRLWASFIPDGHHMPLTTLKNFIRAKTPARTVLTTDAMASELPPGQYALAGFTIEVSPQGKVQKPGEANLAGSALTLDVGVINVYEHCDVPFQEAWQMASVNPARLLGLPKPPTVTVRISAKGFSRAE